MKAFSTKYCLPTVLIAICAVVIISRWGVWFGNSPEPPYTTATTPSRLLLTMGDNPYSRVITWQCDSVVQDAHVEYFRIDSTSTDTLRTIAMSEKYVSEGGTSVFHRATIDRLTHGAYAYRVCHPGNSTQWLRFNIGNNNDSHLQFVFIGDIQDTIGGITHDIVQGIAEQHTTCDFYLLGGDFIHRPQELCWEEAFRGIDPIASSQTILAVSGNHEHRKGVISQCERRFPLHFAYFLSQYNAHDCCFHSFRYDNAEFFLLDSHCDIIKLIKQKSLLEQALQSSTAPWKIAILHHPPYSIKSKWNNIHLRWLFTSLFEQYGVQLVLSGHEHGYARIHPHEEHATPLYTISHCSPKHYTHDNSAIARCYGNDARYYQLITIDNDTLHMDSYTHEEHLYDSATIVQDNKQFYVR